MSSNLTLLLCLTVSTTCVEVSKRTGCEDVVELLQVQLQVQRGLVDRRGDALWTPGQHDVAELATHHQFDLGHAHQSVGGLNAAMPSFAGTNASLNTTTVKPLWPGKAFTLACTKGTRVEDCTSLGRSCFEPEQETQEVLNSFLLDCPGCLYVDIGCNAGYFAAHAAMFGATVDCYEPIPGFVDAMKITRGLNDMESQWSINHMAVVPDDSDLEPLTFSNEYAYKACNMVLDMAEEPSKVPVISIHRILAGKQVKLLKIDIDSNEGALLHTLAKMIEGNETQVETILVEIGDSSEPITWHCRHTACPPPSSFPRGGNISDIWQLQQNHGYTIYRVNTHTAREIFDWTGVNVNRDMALQTPGVQPMFSIRNMKKLERVPPSMTFANFQQLFRWAVTLLITRVELAEPAFHHKIDVGSAQLTIEDLNQGNPSFLSGAEETQ